MLSTRAGGLALTVAGVLFVLAPWLPQGLDLTDDGCHLTNQQQLLIDGWRQEDPSARPLWLSDVVGAAWLRVAGMGLLQARIGWLLLMCFTAAMAFLILAREFPPMSTAAALIAAAVVIHAQGRLLIDYNVVPGVFLLAACGFLLAGGRSAAFFSGVCVAFAAASRLPCIAGMLLPWTLGVNRRRDAALSTAGAVVTLGAIRLLTTYDPAIAESQQFFAPTHSIGSLMIPYARDAIVVAVLAALLLLISMRRWAWIAAIGAAVGALVVLLGRPSMLLQFFSLAGPAVVVAALVRAADRKRELLLLGLVAALAGCIGSNSGLWKMRYGLWLALPAAFLILIERAEPRSRRAMGIAVAVLALMGGTVRYLSPYRDADRSQLTTPIEHPRLRGIFTTPTRAAELQSLLRETPKHVRSGDRMLAFGSIPMLHFLTETRPALGYAWPDFVPAETLRARLDRIVPPPIVIRGTIAGDTPQKRVLEAWLARNGYRVIWRNGGYTILTVP